MWWHSMKLALALASLTCDVDGALEDADYWRREGQARLRQTLRSEPNVGRARNVILFVGDGMGVNTVTAARIYQGQRQGGHGEDHTLSFERFPTVGLAKTYNVDKQVPDSAGTATAMLTGVKSKYGMLGLSPDAVLKSCDPVRDDARRLAGLATWAQLAGKSTGVVTTTRITHATPAGLYSHVNHRDWECDGEMPASERGCVKDIARQLVEDAPGNRFNVILGGGQKQMGAYHAVDDDDSCVRMDERNLPEDWLRGRENAVYVNTSDALMAVDVGKVDHLMGLFSPGHLPYVAERKREHPSLVDMTRKAIELLDKNKDGFFLLVEAGRIDHAHHKNMAKLALQETCELDETVATALTMTDPRETLIIVTADHSHAFTINGYPERGTDILGFANKPNQTTYETLSYANGPGYMDHRLNDSTRPNLTWVPLETMNRADSHYRFLATMNRKDETHAGEDVAVYSTGPFAHLFSGVFEQNYIAHAMAHAACIGPSTTLCDERHWVKSSAHANHPVLTLLIIFSFVSFMCA